MVGLLDLFQPATPDPLGRVLGASYDEEDQRWAGTSAALKAASQALLNPRQGGGGGWARAIGDIGGAMGAAGTAYGEGKTAYLHTAAKNEIAKREIERKKRLEDQEIAQDQAWADFAANLTPEQQKMVQGNPELAKAVGAQWAQSQFPDPAKIAGRDPRLSTTPTKVYNEATKQWEDWQLGSDGQPHRVDYGEGREAQPPGAATIEGKKFANFDEMQNAAYTSVTNTEQAAPLIESLRSDPDLETWGTGYAGYALGNLPETVAMGVRNRTAQLKSLAFFAKLPELKGMGALSNIEGDTATKAINRMDTATTYEEYVAALDDFESVMAQMHERNQRILSSGNWDEMDKIRRENATNTKFKRSRIPPFPGEQYLPEEDWGAFSADEKRSFYDAQKLVY